MNKKEIMGIEEKLSELVSGDDYIEKVKLDEPQYYILATKQIDDSQINKILKLFEIDNKKDENDTDIVSKHYKITYNNKSVTLVERKAEIISEIVKDMDTLL